MLQLLCWVMSNAAEDRRRICSPATGLGGDDIAERTRQALWPGRPSADAGVRGPSCRKQAHHRRSRRASGLGWIDLGQVRAVRDGATVGESVTAVARPIELLAETTSRTASPPDASQPPN